LAAALALGAALVVGTCATVPQMDPTPVPPRVAGASGPLSPERSRAILERVEREGGDMLRRHLAIEEAVADSPLVAGNRVTLLEDGPKTFGSMLEAIRSAKHHINAEFFIFDDQGEVGRQFSAALIEKAKAGVVVNLMYDSAGSQDSRPEAFDRLEQGGVKTLESKPLNPLKTKTGTWNPNNRDHRKILVVDGRVAFTGGINVDEVYDGGNTDQWRDTHLKLEGPIVAEFQKLFLTQWKKLGGEELPSAKYYPKLEPKGDALVRVIATTPDDSTGVAFHAALISAIDSAQSRVWVTHAYFAPPPDLENAFVRAARRGVDVSLVLPSRTDQPKVVYAGRSHYTKLLEAGVRIFERSEMKLHAKTVVVDGVWSVVGSANLDYRSVLYNDEINAVVLGPKFGEAMEAMFKRDLAGSAEVTKEAWANRSFVDRIKEFLARTIETWL
jgi:cardiolipin synthase